MTEAKDVRIEQLESELSELRKHIQNTTLAHDLANKKLQATNDELSWLNQQLTKVSEQAMEAMEFSEAIISNLHEPLLVLDKNLRVLSANSAFYQTFYIAEAETINRHIYTLFNNQWDIPELRTLLESIIPEKTFFTGFKVSHTFFDLGQRTMLLNAREIKKSEKGEKLILLAIENITEKIEAEKTSTLLSTIVNSSDDAIVSKTLQGIITTWNKGAEKIFGYQAQEVIGQHISLIIPPRLLQEEEMIIGKIKAGEPVPHFETLRVTKDGTEVHISVTVSPIKDSEGRITGASKMARDITERKEAAKKIEDQANQLQNIFLNTPAAIALLQMPEQKYLMANNLYQKIFAQSEDELIGKSIKEVFPEEEGQAALEIFDQVGKEGKPYTVHEFPARFSDNGTIRLGYFDFVAQPIKNNAGDVVNIMIHAVEVTEQITARKKIEESESYFRRLTDTVPTIIWITQPDGYCSYLNKHWYEYTGQTEEEGEGYGWLAVTHPDDAAAAGEAFVKANAEQKPFNHTYRLRVKDGSYRWAIDKGSPKFSADGRYEGMIGTVVDIHEEKLAAIQIHESELKMQSLIAAAPIAIGLFIGRDLVIENPNQQFIDIVGKGAGIAGMRLAEAMPELAEQGQPYLKILDDVFTTGKMYKSLGDPVSIVRNGVMHHGFYNIYYVPLFDAEGKVYGIMDIASDVTEQMLNSKKLEESEERFRNLANESPIFVFIVESEITAPVSYWNKTWLDYTGQTYEQALGRAWDGIIHPDDVPGVMETYVPAFENKREYFIPAVRVLRHDGEYRWHSFKGNPRYLPNGNFNGYIGVGVDIHEQKLVEQALAQQKRLYETVADNTEDLIYIFDLNYCFTFANRALLSMWGKTWEQAIGKQMEELGYEDWHARMHRDEIDQVVATKKSTRGEVSFPHATLGTRIYDYIFTPVLNQLGQVEAIAGTTRDITDLKSFTKKLEESETFNRTVLENSPDCVKIIDTDGRLQFMNVNGLCIMEIDDFGSIKNKPWQDLWGEENSELVTAAIAKALTGKTAQFQAFCPTAKGKTRWWDVMLSPVKESGSDHVQNIVSVSRDVTEQRESQDLLEYRKALLEAHNEASVDGLLLVDAKGKILSYNHRFVEIWNMPQQIVDDKNDEAALSFAMTQLVKPEQFLEKVKWLYDNPTETSIDVLEYKDGKIVERHGYPVMAKDGTYYAWSWTFRDITEQKNAERKLIESEMRLRKTTEHFEIATASAEVGVWSLDLQTETLVWSDLHKKMWGYDPRRSDLLYSDWHKIIVPGDKEAAFAELAEALQTKSQYEAIYRIKRADTEEEKWIRSVGQYFYNDAGEAITLTGVSIDVTEQKNAELVLQESEKRFRLLADSMPQHIWTADANGKLNYYNQSVYKYSGLTPPQIDKDGWLQIVHPDDREENARQWIEAVTTGKDFLFEHRFRRFDGEYRWQLSRAIPQKDEAGKIISWVGTSTDIQQQKEQRIELEKAVSERTAQLVTANLQLEENNIALKKMNRELESFTYIASHDLQEPLRKIQTFANRIIDTEEQNLSVSGKDYFRRMKNSSSRMQMLIEDLLAFSHAGNKAGEFVKTNLADIVQEVIADNKEVIQQKGAVVEVGEMCGCYIIPFQFRQIMTNLLSNALKFCSAERPLRISINSEIVSRSQLVDSGTITDPDVLPANKNYCHISVTDNGIGFEPEYREKIFQIFQRLHAKEEYPGTGIGLSIVKKIVENHKGFISATGELNKGTRFDIYLPE